MSTFHIEAQAQLKQAAENPINTNPLQDNYIHVHRQPWPKHTTPLAAARSSLGLIGISFYNTTPKPFFGAMAKGLGQGQYPKDISIWPLLFDKKHMYLQIWTYIAKKARPNASEPEEGSSSKMDCASQQSKRSPSTKRVYMIRPKNWQPNTNPKPN